MIDATDDTTLRELLGGQASWRDRRRSLAGRLRRVREEICGEEGVPDLARRLGVPVRTWRNYEAGVTIPGDVLLAFLDATGVDPTRLTDGDGHD